jgi:hypothetical protein
MSAFSGTTNPGQLTLETITTMKSFSLKPSEPTVAVSARILPVQSASLTQIEVEVVEGRYINVPE